VYNYKIKKRAYSWVPFDSQNKQWLFRYTTQTVWSMYCRSKPFLINEELNFGGIDTKVCKISYINFTIPVCLSAGNTTAGEQIII